MSNTNIQFRKLQEFDLKRMQRWLNTDFVRKWWYNDQGHFTYEDVKKRYLPRIKGEQPTHSFVILHNNIEIGYIQTYLIEDYPDYSKYVNVEERAAGLDLFIGEQDYIHRGLGKQIITKFINNYLFKITGAVSCIIGPEPKNEIAIKTYEKAGFKYLKTIQIPDEMEPEYLMRLKQSDITYNR